MENKAPEKKKENKKSYVPKTKIKKNKVKVILVKQNSLIVLANGNSTQISRKGFEDAIINDTIEV